MNKFITTLLFISVTSVVQAQSYTYTINILNKTNNVTVTAVDNNSIPTIPSVDVAVGQKQTFKITDDGKSLNIYAGSKNICNYTEANHNMLDFTFWLDAGKTSFDVTVSGGYVSGGYQFQCAYMPSGMASGKK